MIIFSKIFGLLVFVFSNVACFSMQPSVVPSFFSEVKTKTKSEIPAYIEQCFVRQSTILPSQQLVRGEEMEIGDIVEPSASYVIDFPQAIRNSARHMIQSGHMGWFPDESHASARSWPSFFYNIKTPFTKVEEAEVFARRLIEDVIRNASLSFHGEVYSGDRSLIGVDFIGDIPSSVLGVTFTNGCGRSAPSREGYKPKDIAKLQKQNESLVTSLLRQTKIDPNLCQANPVIANKLILRISFRKNPMYRDKVNGKFLKYKGYIIDFLSLYPM